MRTPPSSQFFNGIVGGRDGEDDDSYRYRIRLKLQSQNGANEAALRFQILQIPGIQDVVFELAACRAALKVITIVITYWEVSPG